VAATVAAAAADVVAVMGGRQRPQPAVASAHARLLAQASWLLRLSLDWRSASLAP